MPMRLPRISRCALTRRSATRVLASIAGAVLFISSPAFADVPADQAQTIAQAAQPGMFTDVPAGNWAYDAVQQLAAEGLIKGYPNGTFGGKRPFTRYEMAVLVQRAEDAARLKMAAGDTVSADALQKLQHLMDAFGAELKSVEQDVATLKAQTSANTEAIKKTDAKVNAVVAQQATFGFHDTWFIRAPGTYSNTTFAFNGPTILTTPAGTVAPHGLLPNGLGPTSTGYGSGVLTAAGTGAAQTSYVTGKLSHGIGVSQMLPEFSGTFNKEFSYDVRFITYASPEATSGVGAVTPAFCTSTTLPAVGGCGQQAYNGNGFPIRLARMYFQYNPGGGGFYFQGGRTQQNEGRFNSLAVVTGAYANGFKAGFLNDHLDIDMQYGSGDSALGNFVSNGQSVTEPTGLALPQQLFNFRGDYNFNNKHTDLGLAFTNTLGYAGFEWDPKAFLCQNAAGTSKAASFAPCGGATPLYISGVQNPSLGPTPVQGAYALTDSAYHIGSLYGVQYFGKTRDVKVTLEGAYRFGNSALTRQPWTGAGAFAGALDIGDFNDASHPQRPYGNAFQVVYYNFGLNSISQTDTSVLGAPGETASFLTSETGYQGGWIAFNHWFAKQLRVGVYFLHMSLQPGTTLPAGSATCPGCYIGSSNINALYLNSYVTF